MFVSHLDMQRLFQRAFRRADLPLAYSNGFNPHPLLSFATALSVGYTSDCEYFDVMLSEYVSPAEFKRRVNAVLPQGVHIVDAVDAGEFKASLTPLMRSAEYDSIDKADLFENGFNFLTANIRGRIRLHAHPCVQTLIMQGF